MKTKITISVFALLLFFSLIVSSKDSQKDFGIGPIKSLNLNPVDLNKAKWGKSVFEQKCFTCHTLDQKKIGSPLRNVTKTETPEFIMNLLLNTTEMQKKSERIKQLIKDYNNVLMIDYKLSQGDAYNVLEYLRAAAEKKF